MPEHVLKFGFADDESSLNTTGEEEDLDLQNELGTTDDSNEAKFENNTQN